MRIALDQVVESAVAMGLSGWLVVAVFMVASWSLFVERPGAPLLTPRHRKGDGRRGQYKRK